MRYFARRLVEAGRTVDSDVTSAVGYLKWQAQSRPLTDILHVRDNKVSV